MKTITSLSEYVKIIDELSDSLQHDLFRNDILLYRGLKKSSYPLLPSIGRVVTRNVCNSLVWFEKELINEALRKLPDVFGGEQYPVDLLTKLQHYGIPTRLLDITFNAFVALFFACENYEDDGRVVVFKSSSDDNKYIFSRENDVISIMAKQYMISKLSLYSFDKYLEELNHQQGFQNIYPNDVDERESFLQHAFERIQKPICFAPLELSERQKHQQGAFFIFPNETKKALDLGRFFIDEIKPLDEGSDWIETSIIIPASSKSTIQKQLKNYGITQDYLFPDISTICSAITDNVKQRY